ncbi:Manganese transporter SMF2 [Wickerhamiella sorbophila]|uniref:Manganese transporter SMF2 n=1 Tax=Wickerhamiella sorbophila TaxID=45607 RepID=A0A2T0FID2_9ASCO|nr:Manganese transporter SMF2 [Wickerhamiella sorbophila]PRT54750.1 Manganese transporter SMF2 [Wickerhamiella sorbophila]
MRSSEDIPEEELELSSLSEGERSTRYLSTWERMTHTLVKYAKFVGPGIMVSVAYMDPGNYSTAVSAGAFYEYRLLFIVLVSNLFAVVLQVLCAKLGAVTGLNLAENCRKHFPSWLNILLYVLTEIAIIATDLAEVVGTAIALNIIFNLPLSLGVVITVLDVLIVLMAYDPNGNMRMVRYFEWFVSVLVAGVVICFGVELVKIKPSNVSDIFMGFLPSKALLEPKGLYLSCGILGATVMPHSLYLGSGIVQPRLKDFDIKTGRFNPCDEAAHKEYRPSLASIRYSMKYTIAELVISLCTFAVFVNAAILIVSGATLYKTPDAYDADLYTIHDMLVRFLGQAAGTVFALALLFSGQSAGIVCTLSGQMIAEGFIEWKTRPWLRRIITRSIAVAPCLFAALFIGRNGLAQVLNGSQVVLSLLLPFVTAPLIYFTGSNLIMKVRVENNSDASSQYTMVEDGEHYKDMSNSPLLHFFALVIFILVSALNLFMIFSGLS